MGGIRFGGIPLVARRQGPARLAIGRIGRSVGLLAALLVGIFALVPAGASAESLCTDTWTGPSEGSWTTASDWSSGVPTSSSVACIGSGKTVMVTEASQYASVVQGAGSLVMTGGSLEVSDALEVSSIGSLSVTGGTLTGTAAVEATNSFSWSAGAMSGSGSTVVGSAATGTINPGLSGSVYLIERTLANHSTLTWSTASE
jgi:hypothetical protein